jgi:glutaredoxin
MISKETSVRAISKIGAVIAAVALLAATTVFAQYKYIGPDGRVVYSDQPPTSAKGVQKPTAAGVAPAGSNSGGLPFGLQQAVKTFPVTLYTTADCDACTQGRNLLNKRGIPFSEKTVRTQDDVKTFKAATKAEQVPVMMVGGTRQVGFEEAAWNSALSVAGYPPNNLLPPGFKNSPATSAAPPAPEAKSANTPAAPVAPGQTDSASPTGANPPAASSPPPADTGSKPPSWFKGF